MQQTELKKKVQSPTMCRNIRRQVVSNHAAGSTEPQVTDCFINLVEAEVGEKKKGGERKKITEINPWSRNRNLEMDQEDNGGPG